MRYLSKMNKLSLHLIKNNKIIQNTDEDIILKIELY